MILLMLKRLPLFFVLPILTCLISVFLPIKSVVASTFEVGSSITLPLINPDNTDVANDIGNPLGDTQGNHFYFYSEGDPRVIRKVTPNGQIAWTVTLPTISTTSMQGNPDNQGGFYVIYTTTVTRSNLPNATNLFLLHYQSDGTYNVQNEMLLDTLFSHGTFNSYARSVVDNSGILFIFYFESNYGDSAAKSPLRILRVNTSGQIQNTVITQPFNPIEKRWCTNQGTSHQVPYDLPFSGGTKWSACWDWCKTQFLSTPGTCQYNADGIRNCWVNEFPAGGVGNCTWADFTPGYPPYTGYTGITLRQEETVAETFIDRAPLDNLYSLFWIEEVRVVNDGILIYYRISEINYGTTPSSMTSGSYLQKINLSGVSQLAGKGTLISEAPYDDIDLIDDGYISIESIDTNSDTKTDTARIQRYNLLGETQFPGNGIDIFSLIETGTDVYSYLYTDSSSKIYYVVEAWNDSIPASGNVERVFLQSSDWNGSVLLGANGVQIASYEDAHEPEYVNEPWGDGNLGNVTGVDSIGRFFTVNTLETDGSNPARTLRIYWADGNDQVHFAGIEGLSLASTKDHRGWCYGNDSYHVACAVFIDGPTYEQKVYALNRMFQLDLPDGIAATEISNSHDITLGSDYGSVDTTGDVYLSSGSTIFGGATVNLTSDRNWNSIHGESSGNKALMSGVLAASGYVGNATLYVNRDAQDTNILVCPDSVSSLANITTSCSGGVYFNDNESAVVNFNVGSNTVTAEKVTIGANLYWKLTGVGDVGAMSGELVEPTVTPTVTVTETPTPTTSSSTTPTGTLTVTATTTASPTVITVTDGPVFVQNLPSAVVTESSSGTTEKSLTINNNSIACPKFTQFTLSTSVAKQGDEVTVTWKTINAERVVWNNLKTNLISSGNRTIVADESTNIELIADNNECTDIVTKRLSVVNTLPWATTTTVGAGTLVLEAAALQLGAVQGNLWLSALGIFQKKKRGAYGIVYDSTTKKPISRTVVRLLSDIDSRTVDTSVTDGYGVFRFASRQGSYKITIQSAGYSFPSTLVQGPTDGGYSVVYLGGTLANSGNGALGLISIPLDPVATNSTKAFMTITRNFISRYGNTAMRLIILGGFLYSLYAAIVYPHLFNYLIVVLYLATVIGKEVALSKRSNLLGTVIDTEGNPVNGVELGLFDIEFDNLLYRTFTSKEGTYNFAVENKGYYLKVIDSRYDIVLKGSKITAMRIDTLANNEKLRLIAEDFSVGLK